MPIFNGDPREIEAFERWARHKVGHRFGRHHDVHAITGPKRVNPHRSVRARTGLALAADSAHSDWALFGDNCEDSFLIEGEITIDGLNVTVSWFEAGEHDWLDVAFPIDRAEMLGDAWFPHIDVQFIHGHQVIENGEQLDSAISRPRNTGWSAGF